MIIRFTCLPCTPKGDLQQQQRCLYVVHPDQPQLFSEQCADCCLTSLNFFPSRCGM